MYRHVFKDCLVAIFYSLINFSPSFSRPLCESLSDVRRPEIKEEEDLHEAQHPEPRLQRGYSVRRPTGKHRSDWPFDRCDGL